jgi:hypothetical protein
MAKGSGAGAGSLDGSVWEAFCDSLKRSGQRILEPGTPEDGLDRAEGYRCLTRFLRAGLESFLEFGDPDFPVLSSLCHETIKIIADNPDIHYQNCSLRSEHDYRISGTRGTVNYLGFGTQSGDYGRTGTMEPTGFIDSDALEVGDDGRFEIVVSQRPHPGNWLPMTGATNKLVVRQKFLDRKTERKAEIAIERIGGAAAPAPLDMEQLERKLLGAARFVEGTAALAFGWAAKLEERPNELPPADQAFCQSIGGDPNYFYFHGYWRLGPDEALILEPEEIPPCQTWNFQLDNYWMESLDYRYHRVHLNKHTAALRPDGGVRIVVAHEDPGVPNWIETAGHREGTMCFRWVRASRHPKISARVVKFGEVARTA